eukprot:1971999-Alexandrium_andersonii.AAC.1
MDRIIVTALEPNPGLGLTLEAQFLPFTVMTVQQHLCPTRGKLQSRPSRAYAGSPTWQPLPPAHT